MSLDRQQFKVQKLPNGVTLRTHEMDVPFTQVHIVVPVGNVHAHNENSGGGLGTAHFLEHMCFERSELYPEKHQFEKIISAAGGDWNAWTNPYFTDYFLQAPTEDIEVLLPGFFSHIFSPLLLDEDIKTQVGIVLNESKQRKYYPGDDELSRYRYEDWMHIQYYDKDQLFGTKESLEAITTDSLKRFHQNYLQPGIEILVGGKIPKGLLLTLSKNLKTSPKTLENKVELASWKNRTFHSITNKDTDSPIYFWGGNFVEAKLEDLWGITFLCDYLTDHDNGVLNTWIRKEKGWSYGVSAWNWYDRDRMGWTIEIPVSEVEVVNSLRNELADRIATALEDETAINEAKQRTEKSAYFSYQTLTERLDRGVEMLMSFGEIPNEETYKTFLKNTVTPSYLNHIYKTYFASENVGELLVLSE